MAQLPFWRRTLFAAADELFPWMCRDAWEQAQAGGWRVDGSDAYCRRCGAGAGPGAATAAGCSFCLGTPVAWDRLTRLGAYAQPLDRWIIDLKFQHQWTWAERFGQALAQTLDRGEPGQRQVVCPVPMHYWRRWRRGYNQAQLIARALARERHWPLANLLRRARYTRPQTGMVASQRTANVSGSCAARNFDLRGWTVWLVDDVKTTGSTLNACARALRRAGADSIQAVVVAVADSHTAGTHSV